MVFHICTMQKRITYKTIEIPFEDKKVTVFENYGAVTSFWKEICDERDACDCITQHRLSNYRTTKEERSICNQFSDEWFNPMNAIRFMKMMLEWCDEYLPEEVGRKAILEIFQLEDICASHQTAQTSIRVHLKISPKEFYSTYYQLFGFGEIPAYQYFDPKRRDYEIRALAITDMKPLEFRLCMKKGITHYYERGDKGTVPFIVLNHTVSAAIFGRHRPKGQWFFSNIPSYYLTIMALEKYHYGTFNDDFRDIRYFWSAMTDLAQCTGDELNQSFENLVKCCNSLEKGALALRGYLAN